jgi:lipoprotein-releasing system permease protein
MANRVRGPAQKPEPDTIRLRGWIDLAVGLALFSIGVLIFTATHSDLTRSTSTGVVAYFLMAAGGSTTLRGIWRLVGSPLTSGEPIGDAVRGIGYKSFVAWRYLLVARPKVRPTTKRLLAGGLGVVAVLGILRGLGVGPASPGGLLFDPLWIGQVAACVLVFVIAGLGVLRNSKVALITCEVGIGLAVIGVVGTLVMQMQDPPVIHFDLDQKELALQVLNVVAIVGAVLAGLAMFFGCLRAFFTFFTTVPIGGVWIGTAALVMVLAVMSGFESDLRDKILGSNAHVQIVREDGEFVEWREVKARIDQLPGVVASTPYAVSEVVVAANNQPMNVIIKGIDPKTVGKVTDLVSDIESDPGAIQRLDPRIDDAQDLTVPQNPRTGPVIDPAPDDMPLPGPPIDFSGSGASAGGDPGSAGSGGPAPAREIALPPVPAVPPPPHPAAEPGSHRGGSEAELEPPGSYGGDARPVVEGPPPPEVDPPPPDLVTSDEPPADYSRSDYAADSVVRVIDVPFDAPPISKRTQALPGILVGKELAKQTRIYVGQEVHVISPLSDPSNPDATGTPIPFNRDYRVAGVFFTGMYEYDLKYVYVTLDSLQEFLDRGKSIDGIELRLSNPDDTDAFVAKVQTMFGSRYRVQDWKELNRSLFSALKLEKVAMFIVLGIVILVASFSIIGNLIMVVVEKQKEIALLKTLGASDVGVMQLFAIQGLMIGLIGTVLGIATGLVGCWAAKRFGLPLNPDVYYIDKMPIHIEPMSVVAAASAGILISIAATLYPAVVAARVRPAAGMRH